MGTDLDELACNQDCVVQAAVHNALGLYLHLPLLQPQRHIYVLLQSGPLFLEEGQLRLLLAADPLQLSQFSLHASVCSSTCTPMIGVRVDWCVNVGFLEC